MAKVVCRLLDDVIIAKGCDRMSQAIPIPLLSALLPGMGQPLINPSDLPPARVRVAMDVLGGLSAKTMARAAANDTTIEII